MAIERERPTLEELKLSREYRIGLDQLTLAYTPHLSPEEIASRYDNALSRRLRVDRLITFIYLYAGNDARKELDTLKNSKEHNQDR